MERLAAAGIPAAPVVSPSLVTENPQLRDRGFFETLDHPRTGPAFTPARRSPRSTGSAVADAPAADARRAQR